MGYPKLRLVVLARLRQSFVFYRNSVRYPPEESNTTRLKKVILTHSAKKYS